MSMHENGNPDAKKGEHAPESPEPRNELPRWATQAARATPFSDARMAAYIGPRWESTYRDRLSHFFEDPSFTPTWNWAAAIVGPLWFLYRKLYLAFAVFTIVPMIVFPFFFASEAEPASLQMLMSPEGRPARLVYFGLTLSVRLAAAGTANWFLFRRARAASLVVTMQQVPEDVAVSRMQRLGGVNRMPVVLFGLIWLALGVAAALAPAA